MINDESNNGQENKPQHVPEKDQLIPPSHQRGRLKDFLPEDPYSFVASIGVLAGIGYYVYSQNPWLLLTFIGILFGKKVVDQIHHP